MKLVLVGGFLGAGKTTLLAETAKRLTQRGHTVGIITNDQVPDLVDTAILKSTGLAVREVAGSCFCCNFNGFHDAVRSLVENGVDCIVAEPVGSCTDLSATIVQPLKEKFPEYDVAPLTVLVDPLRVRTVLIDNRSLLHDDAAYIWRLQLDEADRIVLNKIDTLTGAECDAMVSSLQKNFPRARVSAVSARSGEGIYEWLDSAWNGEGAGANIATVDYDRYANGEAVLGWLNAVVSLRWIDELVPNWKGFVHDLLATIQQTLLDKQCEIGHIKMLLDTPQGRITANLTALDDTAQISAHGFLERLNATLTINARVQMAPEGVDTVVRELLKKASYGRVAATIGSFHCIKPGRPVPTYRYDAVVK